MTGQGTAHAVAADSSRPPPLQQHAPTPGPSRQSSPSRRASPQVGLSPLVAQSRSRASLDPTADTASLQPETDGDADLLRLASSNPFARASKARPEGRDKRDPSSSRRASGDGAHGVHGEHHRHARPAAAPAPTLATSADELLPQGIAEYTLVPSRTLGAGKFSKVMLAMKDGRKHAIKHTPLHPHHELVATRLLREPHILARLPAHPNLIRVYETIRTPGHFYLVEEALDDYVTLETFVASFAEGGRLRPPQAKRILDQLVSVTRDAIHHPIHVCHRDIKPENILIHPQTLHIVLLDFGLATHYAASEPKLTTCCGSPAFHSPELFSSLRSPPGTVTYFGPEIDAWCIGVTLLRCLIGRKYPLGIKHASLQAMADKTADACLAIEDRGLRRTIAGLLDFDGEKRMEALRLYEVPEDVAEPADRLMSSHDRAFKSTTFVAGPVKHHIDLALADTGDGSAIDNSGQAVFTLQSPGGESFSRILSFLKYVLRCAGIIYHCPCEAEAGLWAPDDVQAEEDTTSPDIEEQVLHCVTVADRLQEGSRATVALKDALRPALRRAATTDATTSRSSSTPPSRGGKGHTGGLETQRAYVKFDLIFSAVDAAPASAREGKATEKHRRRRGRLSTTSIAIRVPDERLRRMISKIVASALGQSNADSEEGPAPERGRQAPPPTSPVLASGLSAAAGVTRPATRPSFFDLGAAWMRGRQSVPTSPGVQQDESEAAEGKQAPKSVRGAVAIAPL